MGKRTRDQVREYFSRKMRWLSAKCCDPLITDGQFRVLFALIVGWLDNESEWCKPTDKKLGETCGKSGRTIRRLTSELQEAGHIEKRKNLGPSDYTFDGLNQDRPTLAAVTPATLGTKTGQVGYEDRPPVGRTRPSDSPTDSPSKEGDIISEEKEGHSGVVPINFPANQLAPEREARNKVERHISADPFVRENRPTPETYQEAVSAELTEVGSGAEILRRAANEIWKARRSA